MNIFSTLARLAATPQGRQMLRKAKVAAADPRNRARVEELVGKAKDKALTRGQAGAGVDGGPGTPGRTAGRPVAGGGRPAADSTSDQALPVVEGTVVSETVEAPAPAPDGRQPRA